MSRRSQNPEARFEVGDLVRYTPEHLRRLGKISQPVNAIVVGHQRPDQPEIVWSDDDRARPQAAHQDNLELDERGMAQSSPQYRQVVVRELIGAQKKGNPAPKMISGPLRIEEQADGLWVVGQGIASPVESRAEAKRLIAQLLRRPNSPGATEIVFDDVTELAHGLETMDLALRPSRFDRPTVFRVDWEGQAVVLEGDPDDPGVSQAIRALERADVHFDVAAIPAVAANPKDGTRGKAAGYALLGMWAGGILGFGLGALVGGLAGLAAGGTAGAVIGALLAGAVGGYAGGIWGAWKGAERGAPAGLESDAAEAAAIGAAIPYLNWFLPPVLAYMATAPE